MKETFWSQMDTHTAGILATYRAFLFMVAFQLPAFFVKALVWFSVLLIVSCLWNPEIMVPVVVAGIAKLLAVIPGVA